MSDSPDHGVIERLATAVDDIRNQLKQVIVAGRGGRSIAD